MAERTIYLVRHGRPDFPLDARMCIGSTNVPLGDLGRMQALLIGRELEGRVDGGVFCSMLSRAMDTAAFISPDYVAFPGLEEAYAGEWEGKSFEEIERDYPELYAAREYDFAAMIPGSEDEAEAAARFESALRTILLFTQGDIAVVAHTTVIGAFAALISGEDPHLARKYRQECGSIRPVRFDGDSFFPAGEPYLPAFNPDEALCMALHDASGNGENIKAHCAAVARRALEICDELENHGVFLDRTLVKNAALLHDIARREKHHETLGGKYISMLGRPDIGEVIRTHSDLDNTDINEASVVFIADKIIKEASPVTVAERYTASKPQCSWPAAIERHQKSLSQALEVKEKINALCGKEIII